MWWRICLHVMLELKPASYFLCKNIPEETWSNGTWAELSRSAEARLPARAVKGTKGRRGRRGAQCQGSSHWQRSLISQSHYKWVEFTRTDILSKRCHMVTSPAKSGARGFFLCQLFTLPVNLTQKGAWDRLPPCACYTGPKIIKIWNRLDKIFLLSISSNILYLKY
jgi:hypothetical protein